MAGIGLVVVVVVVVVAVVVAVAVVVGSVLDTIVLDVDVGESVLLPCGSLDSSKFNFASFLLKLKECERYIT